MAHTLSTAGSIEVDDWIVYDGSFQQVTKIRDMPATDIETASRFIHTHTGELLAMYTCEPIAVQV